MTTTRDCLAFILFSLVIPCLYVAATGSKTPFLILVAAVWLLIVSHRREPA